MADQQGKDLMAMDSRMFSAKESIDSLHQEIAEFFYCERADFTTKISYGSDFGSHLTDFYPTLVRRELGDQIGAMVRPADRQWFKSTTSNKDIARRRDASEYLEFMTRVNWAILYSPDSGFRRAAKEADHDWATFGMSWKQVSYNKKRDNLLFRCHHPKKMAGCEGPDGRVNHVHRKEDMKAHTMAYWFGEAKLPQAAKDALAKKDYERTFTVRHIFVPLDKYDPYRKFPKGAGWADIYVTEDGHILQEQPAFTFDYIVPRWATISGHFYAFSPATIIALPQARMIQRMMMTLIEAGEKRVDPPLVATEDVINSAIDISSGGITYIDSEYDERLGAALRPLDLGKDVGLGENLIADARRLLADAFYINKLNLPQDRQKTAYETSQLVQEYIRNALPLFEPIEDEDALRTLDLVSEKVMRAGGYGAVDRNGIPVDMPEALLGQNITQEFNSTLKEARDRQVINGFHESAALIATAAQIDPGVTADVDVRKSFRDAFGAVPGGYADWLNDQEAADAQRAQMQKQQAQQAALAQTGAVADVAGRAGQAAQEVQAAMNG
ncbi:portal protein [Rhizobium sp. 21-4511-3d]